MLTLQRSPWIVCAQIFDQVKFEKNPTLSNLGAGDFSGACLFLQRNWMNLEEIGGLLQGECLHVDYLTRRLIRIQCMAGTGEGLVPIPFPFPCPLPPAAFPAHPCKFWPPAALG